MKVFDTTSKLALASLEAKQYVMTYGDSSSNDLSGSLYYVSDSLPNNSPEDVTTANGNVAKHVMAFESPSETLPDLITKIQSESDDQEILTQAKTYTDQEINTLSFYSRTSVDSKDTQTLNNANAYTDSALTAKADLEGSGSQRFNVASGTSSTNAVNKNQLDTKANLEGSSGQVFSVATATGSTQAVPKSQLDSGLSDTLAAANAYTDNNSGDGGGVENFPNRTANIDIEHLIDGAQSATVNSRLTKLGNKWVLTGRVVITSTARTGWDAYYCDLNFSNINSDFTQNFIDTNYSAVASNSVNLGTQGNVNIDSAYGTVGENITRRTTGLCSFHIGSAPTDASKGFTFEISGFIS